MAIVFVSPRRRQKVLFSVIISSFLLFAVFVSLAVFLSKSKTIPVDAVFSKPEISLDFNFLNSELLKSMEKLEKMQIQFDYKATTKEAKETEGKISATSAQEAANILKERGLNVLNLEKSKIGRENPFTPYYQNQAPNKK